MYQTQEIEVVVHTYIYANTKHSSPSHFTGDKQRVVKFLAAGTQEDKQRFIDLLHAKIDRG
jgi:hypothetical protein